MRRQPHQAYAGGAGGVGMRKDMEEKKTPFSLRQDGRNVVYLSFGNQLKGKLTFLEEDIFRYDANFEGSFPCYARPREQEHKARIQQYPDSSQAYTKPEARIRETQETVQVACGSVSVIFEKETARMQVQKKGKILMEEAQPLVVAKEETVQRLRLWEEEDFFGGGTQNGRFVHTGEKIQIVNESAWMDGGVASPAPFYYTTSGYGVLRNTFSDGAYDFGKEEEGIVKAVHKEAAFSAYYFLSGGKDRREVVRDILQGYYHVTGNPILLPEYGFYEGHLNCYNRDAWSEDQGEKAWTVKGRASFESQGRTRYENGMRAGFQLSEGQHSESLNGERPKVAAQKYPESVDTPYEYSARYVLDTYGEQDMPLGYFLPNDGYGGGYGQNGYYMQGGVLEDGTSSKERIQAVDANIANIAEFTQYANSKGVASGLWTESNLSPDSDNKTYWHLLRDFQKEVGVGGITTLKTDVAWVGPGYSFQLNGVKTAYDIVTTLKNFRPNLISLDGWAGSQRFNSVWTGDQTGGNWEYIRFHIPTYIGSSLSGNPNIGSDMDGIFGGKALIQTRDYQWKSFTPQMLNMDGWGSYMKAPFTFGDPYTGINRMYMKKKARLMPYLYTCAVSAANIDTGNGDTALPIVRAMFLEYPQDPYACGLSVQYQFMLGSQILVAPVYQNVAADEMGNDVRNNIYLPGRGQVWIDYLSGEKYQGGQVLNNFKAPLWKLPVFVKSGAILPMYGENNSPDGIDRTKRYIEFWPEGKSQYTVYEDDGKYLSNQTQEDEDYGVIDHISYGDCVRTRYLSLVEGDRAVLKAEKSQGSYQGYEPQRVTTFIVHLTDRPTGIGAKNGSQILAVREAQDREAFRETIPGPGEAIWFYEEDPGINTYASGEEEKLAELVAHVATAPVLSVKLAAADTGKVCQSVEITGYVNALPRQKDAENPALAIPQLSVPEGKKTSESIWLAWDRVEGAGTYEMLVDGRLYGMGAGISYLHDGLSYDSGHTYQIRARNQEGYSPWSQELAVRTLRDPWRNEIGAGGTILWEGGDEAGALKYATDHSYRGLFFAADDVVTDKIPLVFDFGSAYELDHFEYCPRDSYGSGTVQQMNIYAGLDGKHWTIVWDGAAGEEWHYDTGIEAEKNIKQVSLDGVSARFLKLEIVKSIRNYFASHELSVFKKDGSSPFAVGSTNKNEKVSEGDYVNMKNYLGTSLKDGATFVNQIQKRNGDINGNGIYDVYDYSYTMFQLDGGTRQEGKVSGRAFLHFEKEKVSQGEQFQVFVMGEDAQNVNAFGKVLAYDPSRLAFVSTWQDSPVGGMENLTVNKSYGDGTAAVNLAFANRGDQPLFSGSGQMASITFKALADISPREELPGGDICLIGPGHDLTGEV